MTIVRAHTEEIMNILVKRQSRNHTLDSLVGAGDEVGGRVDLKGAIEQVFIYTASCGWQQLDGAI